MALKPGLPSSEVCSPHTAVFAGAPYRLRTTAGVETACSPVLLLRVSRDPRARTSPGAAHTSWGRAQSLCPVCIPCLAGSPAWQSGRASKLRVAGIGEITHGFASI